MTYGVQTKRKEEKGEEEDEVEKMEGIL